jgi:hypothetical protein
MTLHFIGVHPMFSMARPAKILDGVRVPIPQRDEMKARGNIDGDDRLSTG